MFFFLNIYKSYSFFLTTRNNVRRKTSMAKYQIMRVKKASIMGREREREKQRERDNDKDKDKDRETLFKETTFFPRL
jgi:hypothetical protein